MTHDETTIQRGDPVKHVREIARILERARLGRYRMHTIWGDWVEATFHTLRQLPRHLESVVEVGTYAAEDAASLPFWERFDAYYSGDAPDVHQCFGEALGHLLLGSEAAGTHYHDLPGEVYMILGQSNPDMGQYFTPIDVGRAMAQMIAEDAPEERLMEHIRAAVVHRPEYQCLELMECPCTMETLKAIVIAAEAEGERIVPTPLTVCDPTCGSGTLLLAMAQRFPEWALHRGYVRFYGQDLDRLCVLMARINMMLYGLNGTAIVLCPKDTYTNTTHITLSAEQRV